MANLASFAIVLLFFYGRSLRFSNLPRHMLLMKIVIVLDLLLVIALVAFRNALGKVASMEMPWTLKIHVPIAVFTVLLYFPTAYTGYQLAKGKPVHARMRLLDRILVPARLLTLITSLMVQFIAVK